MLHTFLEHIEFTPPFIIKPNWIHDSYGHFTDPVILRWVLEFFAAKGKTVLTEAYSSRNSLGVINLQTTRLDDAGLATIRRTEQEFLANTGIAAVLDKWDIEYINVTEEFLKDAMVDPHQVQKAVTAKYGEISQPELYSFIPVRLYEFRHGTFINLAKFKVFFSMCVKNLFGMIPDFIGTGPRYKYHGKRDRNLAKTIAEMNMLYHTFFRVVGLVEGIKTLTCEPLDAPRIIKAPFGYDYGVLEDKGLLYYGDDTLWLDAFIHQQCRKDPSETQHLAATADILGMWPDDLLAAALHLTNPLGAS